MALKYWFEFKDVKAIIHKVEISKEDFDGDSIQIYGSCSLEYSETKDTLEPIRGSGLKIDLEADSDLTFYDLYSEEERTFSVVYRRDNEILFNGWLSPEGIYESLVSDKWVISLDCTDGLGFLKNLSYVEDASGLNFVGKQSLLEIIVNCLKRTKTPQNILTSVKIYYDGLSQTLDPFDNIYFNANRFVKEDSNPSGSDGTIMNCEEVLKSVLEPFGAVITAHKGEWLIYKPNSLVNNSEQVFFTYDSLGIAMGAPSRTINFTFNLGSQINGYYPHHANGNQQKTIKSSIGAFRINYKYGLVPSLLKNGFLQSSDGIINNWVIDDGATIILPSPEGMGVGMPFSDDIADGLNITSSASVVGLNDVISFNINFKVNFPTLNGIFKYQLVVSDVEIPNPSAIVYQLQDDFSWDTVSNGMEFLFENNTNVNKSIVPQPIPIDGFLYLYIQKPQPISSIPVENKITIISVELVPDTSVANGDGQNHTFQRLNKPSSKIKDVKEVFNGDSSSSIYNGAIYKNDKVSLSDLWSRGGVIEAKSILQIMGEERMKMYSKPLQVYSGDVYGYFNYLSLVTINNLTGVFMPTSYNYKSLENITSLKLIEVLNTDILDDIDYKVTLDYGNVVEPTITG